MHCLVTYSVISKCENIWDKKNCQFPDSFVNTNVCKQDTGPLIARAFWKGKIFVPTAGILISSFEITNGTMITPLQFFYLELGLLGTKIYRFVEYSPVQKFQQHCAICFQCPLSRRHESQIQYFSITMKLLANSSYGYQKIDRSRHSFTRCMKAEQTHTANFDKNFRSFWHMNFTR